MRSPVADCEMRPIEYEGCVIWTCPSSGGELVTPEAMRHIVNTREQRFGPAWDELVADHDPLMGEPADDRSLDLECPCCGSRMTAVNYGGDSAIYIDRCPDCGAMWLDPDELELIQVVMERWQDVAPQRLREIGDQLHEARERAERESGMTSGPSRFSFVNAVINRLLDAA